MKNNLCKFLYVIFFIIITVSNIISKGKIDSLNFFIFSDPHYIDPSLGTETELLQKEELTGIKMHKESQKIFEKTVEIILQENVDIILIPGDLTKDGEKKSNEKVSKYLTEIEKKGKRVFVIPGNHDINNSESFSYSDKKGKTRIPNTSPEDFKAIYKDFGYEEALYKDPESLSYIAALNKNTWLLALAPLKSIRIKGEFTSLTLNWLKTKLIEAKKKNITVFAMIHHGVLEHHPYISKLRKDRLINEWGKTASLLIDYDIKIIFTGHTHANDIEIYKKDNNFIVDILTGSTIIWPCSYRLVNYNKKSNELIIKTKNLNYKFLETNFQDYAYDFINKHFPIEAKQYLIKMKLNDQSIDIILPLLIKTYIAFFHGDESKNKNEYIINSINNILNDYENDNINIILAKALLGIWNDNTPDRDVKINLNNGNIEDLR